ncbi:MAG: hypothetical protein ABIV21_02450, partial [Pyrinomonadaceae bacterium]
MSDEVDKVEAVRTAFRDEFKPFAILDLDGMSLNDAQDLMRELSDLKVRHSGKKSAIAGTMKLIGKVSPEGRSEFGQLVQSVEKEITAAIEIAETTLNDHIVNAQIERERLDVTIPGRRPKTGHLHLITILRQKIEDIFVSMGYAIENDREIETDYYNFDALNIPEGHPA